MSTQQKESLDEKLGRIKRSTPTVKPMLPIIGNIRIGEKRQPQGGGKEYPVSLDYFKPVGDYAKLFTDAYGEKPNKIQVVFISDNNSNSCLEEYEARDAQGKRAGYGDGETYYLYDEDKKDYVAYRADDEKDKAFVAKFTKDNKLEWKVILTLLFLIPKIKGVFGVWKFQTKGAKSSVEQIINAFDMIKETAGTVINIPFDLTVEKVKSQKPNNKSVFPVVNLVPNISNDNIEIVKGFLAQGGNVKQLGMLTEDKLKQLPEGKVTIMLNEKNDK